MDKYEYKVRAEEIKTLISQKKYVEAAKVADSIDWTRVKSVMMLCTVSDLYKVNRRFDDAKLLLEMANERHPAGRMIIYSLCDLSIKMGEVVQAIEYYKDFVQIAPNDSGRYVLQYKIYEAQDVGLEERIAVLEELKKRDYREKWAYELAYLYHRVGLATKCVEECDELILWFGEGKYVIKAMELKLLHQPLSPAQQQKFEIYMMRKQGLRVPEPEEKQKNGGKNAKDGAAAEDDIHVKPMDVGKYNTINLQKELARSMEELMLNGKSSGEPVSLQAYKEQLAAQEQACADQAFADQSYNISADTGEMDQQNYGGGQYVGEQFEQYEYEGEASGQEYYVQEQPAAYAGEAPVQEPWVNSQPELNSNLSPEYEGQIGDMMTEDQQLDRQVTGQMNIEDIMKEWEKMKQENEEKRRKQLQQRVMEQTGSLFRDFDETARKGVLERLQKEERIPVERKRHAESSVISAHTKIWAAGEVENAIKRAVEPAGTAAQTAAALTSAAQGAGTAGAAAASEAISAASATGTAAWAAAPTTEPTAAAGAIPSDNGAVKPAAVTEIPPAAIAPEPGMKELSSVQSAAKPRPAAAEVPEQQPVQAAAPEEIHMQQEAGPEAEENQPQRLYGETAAAAAEEAVTEEQYPQEQYSQEQYPQEQEESAASGRVRDEQPEEARPEQENRSMSREEKQLFATFVPTRGAMKSLVRALDRLSLAAYTGNLIITGEPGSDTMKLTKNIVRDFRAKDHNFSGKLAKIDGEAFSRKNPNELISKLAGGALVIDGAGDITDESMNSLMDALNQEQTGILVVLVDTKRNIKKLISANPEMESFFNARFDIEALDNGTLVAYGCQYAKMQEYAIDELGRLALHTRIEDMQTSDHIVTVNDVRDIVDEAIAHANRKTPKHFMDVLLAKRYDDDDMIILHEGDFI